MAFCRTVEPLDICCKNLALSKLPRWSLALSVTLKSSVEISFLIFYIYYTIFFFKSQKSFSKGWKQKVMLKRNLRPRTAADSLSFSFLLFKLQSTPLFYSPQCRRSFSMYAIGRLRLWLQSLRLGPGGLSWLLGY